MIKRFEGEKATAKPDGKSESYSKTDFAKVARRQTSRKLLEDRFRESCLKIGFAKAARRQAKGMLR